MVRKMRPARNWRSWRKRKYEGATGSLAIVASGHDPSQPPPRIAIASDVPPRGRKFGDLHAQGAVQPIGHTVVPESGRAYISLPIATQAAAYRIVSAQNAARKVLSSMTANHGKGGASINVM